MTRKPKIAPVKAAAPVVTEQAQKQQAARVKDVSALDDLPDALRSAIRGCDFYIAIPKMRRGLDVAALVKMIEAVRNDRDAIEVNRIINTQINGR